MKKIFSILGMVGIAYFLYIIIPQPFKLVPFFLSAIGLALLLKNKPVSGVKTSPARIIGLILITIVLFFGFVFYQIGCGMGGNCISIFNIL